MYVFRDRGSRSRTETGWKKFPARVGMSVWFYFTYYIGKFAAFFFFIAEHDEGTLLTVCARKWTSLTILPVSKYSWQWGGEFYDCISRWFTNSTMRILMAVSRTPRRFSLIAKSLAIFLSLIPSFLHYCSLVVCMIPDFCKKFKYGIHSQSIV